MRQLSDDWLSENSQWFRDYEGSFKSVMPDVVSSFVRDKSLDNMSSADILRTIDWLRDHPITHVEMKANGEPHVIPFIDPVTGKHPAGYYHFDEGFLDCAMSKNWLSLPVDWYYGQETIAGIADTFDEVKAHIAKLSEQYSRSDYGFVRKQQFVVLVRETSDLSLVHEFSHVGEWGEKIRKREMYLKDPCPINYVWQKEIQKAKRVIHHQYLDSLELREFNEKFIRNFSLWAKNSYTSYVLGGRNPYCNTHHVRHRHATSKCGFDTTIVEPVEDSENVLGFPVFTKRSFEYEKACKAFVDSKSSRRNKIFQFEVLRITPKSGIPPTHPADIW